MAATLLCLRCGKVLETGGYRCPRCRELLSGVTEERVERVVAKRTDAAIAARIIAWRESGLLESGVAEKLIGTLAPEVAGVVPPPAPLIAAAAVPTVPAPAAEGAESAATAEPGDATQHVPGTGDAAESYADVSARLFGGEGAGLGAAAGAVGLLAALDQQPPAPKREPWLQAQVWPVFYENIGWFIGALFVLAGSIYGVREAWEALGGASRNAVVAGALLAYHAAFVGLGAFLSKRAATAGRVLGAIGVGLLPMVFAALGATVGASAALGVPLALTAAVLTTWTLASVSRRFELPRWELAIALLPALLAELPAPSTPVSAGLFAFIGTGAVLQALLRTNDERRALLVPFALYGAFALEILIAVRIGSMGADLLAPGSIAWAGLVLRLTLLGAGGAVAFPRKAWTTPWPHLAPALEVTGLGMAATTAVVAAASFAADGPAPYRALLLTSIAVTTGAFFLASRRHPLAMHAAALGAAVSGWLFGDLVGGSHAWGVLNVAALAAAGLQISRAPATPATKTLLRWSVFLAIWSLPLAVSGHAVPAELAGALIALGAFRAGAFERRPLHYLGSAAAIMSLTVWCEPYHLDPIRYVLGLAAIFGMVGLGFDVAARRFRPATADSPWQPFDDVSFLLLLGAAFGTADRWRPGLGLSGLGFLLRSWRDRSRVVSALGAALVALWVFGMLPDSEPRISAIVLLFAAVAAARGMSAAPLSGRGRPVFGRLALPWPAPVRVIWTDGFAITTMFGATAVVANCLGWITHAPYAGRALQEESAALTAAVAALAFLTPAFETWRARGALSTWALVVASLGLVGAIHRVGNPLPPLVEAERLTAIATLCWLGARALVRWGPALGRALGKESDGRAYHLVPHAGTAVLGAALLGRAALLFADGLSPADCPPELLAGAAWCALLLARSTGNARALNIGLPIILASAALAGARSDGAAQIELGLAVTGLVLAAGVFGTSRFPAAARALSSILLGHDGEQRQSQLTAVLARWSVAAGSLVLAMELLHPQLLSAVVCVLAGLLLAGSSLRGRSLFALCAVLAVIHAVALLSPTVPLWAGPSMALIGLAIVATGPAARRALSRQGSIATDQLVAMIPFVAAILYSLAEGGRNDPTIWAALSLSIDIFSKLAGHWAASPALGVTLVMLGVSRWRAGTGLLAEDLPRGAVAAYAEASLSVSLGVLLNVPAMAAMATHDHPGLELGPVAFVVSLGWMLAPGATLIAIALHQGRGPLLVSNRLAAAEGLRIGRDTLLVAVLILVSASVGYPAVAGETRPPAAASLAFFALLMTGLLAAQAARRERRPLQVYLVQLCAVGLYGLVRTHSGRGLPPEADSCFALTLGFVLLGVTVLARRANIAPVATATRRFAALLPVAMALVTPHAATATAALLAAGGGLLWAALGWVENSRFLGSLGAAGLNLALFVAALSAGLNGPEIYIAPFGLMTLALGQIFSASLSPQSRLIVRVIGSLVAYVPAAAQIALPLGSSPTGEYAVGFGVACLLGIVVGMALRIRAYLALGTGFLVLDVVSNLVQAGLRDHRVGFAVLSLSGLGILGSMVFLTLQRELVRRQLDAWRGWVAGWE